MTEENVIKLDTKGLKCPLPVIRVKKAITGIEIGQIIEVESTDPGSMADFKAWARATGHELLAAEEQGSVFFYRIKKAK
ncbi:sulfurtransferase TusA family protein [Ferviditalea candida]|uniref:Sulfurtransferase TusA family protein n=1 Tax=Ferviditalea candida TaxID=3108399 RepID=A0ABU5ZKD6_9BACL|nr:sulfurtransferase TusA family protein [Paenibacillaceae bacterium T2]